MASGSCNSLTGLRPHLDRVGVVLVLLVWLAPLALRALTARPVSLVRTARLDRRAARAMRALKVIPLHLERASPGLLVLKGPRASLVRTELTARMAWTVRTVRMLPR